MQFPDALTCPFCSLHCDDLHLETGGDQLKGIAPACPLAETRFREAWGRPSAGPASAGIEKAARRLAAAKRALVIIGGEADQAAVTAGWRLAQATSATLVNADSAQENLALAMASIGMLSATLGDLRQMNGQVALLGVTPTIIAPRFWERIGVEKRAAAIDVPGPDALVALRWLRLARREPGEPLPDRLATAARRIAAAPAGLAVFGQAWLRAGTPPAHELLAWLAELNQAQRWYGLYLPETPNATGVTETLLSLCGCPGNLYCEESRAHFAPRETRRPAVLDAADVIVIVGGAGGLDARAWPADCQRKTILVGPQAPRWQPGLWLPAAQPGLDAPGSMLRADGVPVELGAILPAARPEAALILDEICREVAR